jgi:hypothetical protein
MIAWIDAHGIATALILFVFSTIVSSAPKQMIPKTWGFWRTWGFNALQALGANAGNYAKGNPLIQKLEATEVSVDSDGTKTATQTSITSTPASNVGVPPIPKA